MQAMFIMSLFTLLFAIMANIVASGSSNSSMLNHQRIEETQSFFNNIATMVKNDITTSHYTAVVNDSSGQPITAIADYIRALPELVKLSSGRYSDPALDAWGHPIQGAVATQYELLSSAADTTNQVNVPVTAIALISGGPDGIVQTPVRTDFSGILNTIVPRGADGKPTNDDIVYTFNNRDDQMRIMQDINKHMNRIGVAALMEWQGRLDQYRAKQIQDYKNALAAGQSATPPNTDISTDPNVPQMLTLTDVANRVALGVDEDFKLLERTITQYNGDSCDSLQVTTATPASINDPLQLTLTNKLNRACTPWHGKNGSATTFRYVLNIYPNKQVTP